ncbi:transporter substrate-binding domain-containing protein [Geminicoccaceae bacterium 1502E]|nr:transporter substrate-binding domain-containing protein [Geminicoccaceae bacterium 1502E]
MTATRRRTEEPWRVGVLFSCSGPLALIEQTQLKGTLLAIEEINEAGGVDGREVVPVIYDPGSDDASFAAHAQRLMLDDQVSCIFGCYASSSRKAVLPVVERLDGLLWYPTLYEGFENSANVVYTGAAPNQNSLALCNHLLGRHGQRFFFVGSDYVYPRESNRVMRAFIEAGGGEVVGEAYAPLRAARHDFVPIVRQIRTTAPDIVFSTVVGQATKFFYQCFAEAGLEAARMPIASLTTSETEVRAMGHDVARGHLTAASYFQGVGGSSNRDFLARFRKRFGEREPANMCAEAAYFQMHLFSRALAAAGTMESDVLRACLAGLELEAPQGPVQMASRSGHARLWTRIGRVDDSGEFEIIAEAGGPTPADPYLVSHDRNPTS